jgi:hypothetical protein
LLGGGIWIHADRHLDRRFKEAPVMTAAKEGIDGVIVAQPVAAPTLSGSGAKRQKEHARP